MAPPTRTRWSRHRLGLIVTTAMFVVAACGDATIDSNDDDRTPARATSSTLVEAGPGPAVTAFPEGPSALDSIRDPSFPEPLVDVTQIISGGPPPDGIPPIDEPTFVDVADNLDLLPAAEAVVALEIDGDARAYPIRAMVWHEIVNDVVGGVPVTVSYCPLCNSAATYERVIDGNVTTFGTSGRLFASALVMYDRATESLWTHFDGKAVVGLLVGEQLRAYPSPLLAWSEFIEAYPTGKVLDWEAAGFARDYGRNPYSGYDTPDNSPFLFRGALDDRAAAMQRVIGIGSSPDAIAYALEAVSGGEANVTVVPSSDFVIFWRAGQASALEDGAIDGGRDVGSVGVFRSQLAGERLMFDVDGDMFVDTATGSRWSVTGRALSGPLAGSQLEQVPHLDTFWFAWSTYQPGSALIE